MRLRTIEHIDTREATELIRKAVWPKAKMRLWHCGNFRRWELPEPKRLKNGRLVVARRELEKWLVKHGYAEFTEL